MRRRLAVRLQTLAAICVCLRPAFGGSPNPSKFLIVSAPRDAQVGYLLVQRGGDLAQDMAAAQTDAGPRTMKVLIKSGLMQPQGIAVEQLRKRLLVTDPEAQKVYSYPLSSHEDTLSVGAPVVLAHGIEARWVAVDTAGNIFLSVEPTNQILRITPEQALRRGNPTTPTTPPQVVYDGEHLPQVSAPGALAADSFHAYWVNKQLGNQVGSVVRARESDLDLPSLAGASSGNASSAEGASSAGGAPSAERAAGEAAARRLVPLARNAEKSYGLCLALNNVYYTQPETSIYGVKKVGMGDPVLISSRLTNPRGCAWDGGGTVYVADRGANAVYSFAGNMQDLGAAQMSKTVDFGDAFGVAVYSSARRAHPLFEVVLSMLPAMLAALLL